LKPLSAITEFTVSHATALLTLPCALLTPTVYAPASSACRLFRVSEAPLFSLDRRSIRRHAYASGAVPTAVTLNVALCPTSRF